jgi:hypothetical protein
VFGELVRNGAGQVVVTLKGKAHQLDVVLGQNCRALVIYVPRPAADAGPGCGQPGGSWNSVGFESMLGIANAMSLAHKRLCSDFQSVAPQ